MLKLIVENCCKKFSSKFELIKSASDRARKMHLLKIVKKGNKATVMALKEIDEKKVDEDVLILSDLKKNNS